MSRHLNSSTRKVRETEKEKIQKAIGIVLYMGVMKLPNRRMYWNTRCSSELILGTMSRIRFDENNNEIQSRGDTLYNKCHETQPLIDHFCIVL